MLPVLFGAVDGEASWLDESRSPAGPHRLFSPWPNEATRPALFTALRTGFADQLLREAFVATRSLRAERRRQRGLSLGADARGLGKMLVVAPDQPSARRYAEILRGWVPKGAGRHGAAGHLGRTGSPSTACPVPAVGRTKRAGHRGNGL